MSLVSTRVRLGGAAARAALAAALALGALSAQARPAKPPQPPIWGGPMVLSVAAPRAEDALIRSRLIAPGDAGQLRVQVRALAAEEPLGTFEVAPDALVRIRGLSAGTWAIEAATQRDGVLSRWSDPLVVEVQAVGEGVLTVLQGTDAGLAPGPCTEANGQPWVRALMGEATVKCPGEAPSVHVKVVEATATLAAPANPPRGKPTSLRFTLTGGPVPQVLDLVVAGRAWPLRLSAQGWEAVVTLPAGFQHAELRDPDQPDGPPVAVVTLPGAGGAK